MSRSEDGSTLIPNHIGFIMDGNRRWAKSRGLNSLEGHAAGQEALYKVAYRAIDRGVQYVSAYAFSTENWSRSKQEVAYLMAQVSNALGKYIDEFVENGIKLRIVGSREGLSKKVLKSVQEAEEYTKGGERATIAVCFNYGGYQEIVDATKSIISAGIEPDRITPEEFAKHLYCPELPPIDLVVRTSGEQRLSNFMLWRSAYSEFIFRDEMWPDFGIDELDSCLLEYTKRQRRFGG